MGLSTRTDLNQNNPVSNKSWLVSLVAVYYWKILVYHNKRYRTKESMQYITRTKPQNSPLQQVCKVNFQLLLNGQAYHICRL